MVVVAAVVVLEEIMVLAVQYYYCTLQYESHSYEHRGHRQNSIVVSCCKVGSGLCVNGHKLIFNSRMLLSRAPVHVIEAKAKP